MNEWVIIAKREQDDDTRTVALEITGSGCLVRMCSRNTYKDTGCMAEAITFVPRVRITGDGNGGHMLVGY